MAPIFHYAALAVLFTSALAMPAKDKHSKEKHHKEKEHKGSPTLPFIPTGTGIIPTGTGSSKHHNSNPVAERDAAPKFGNARKGDWKPHWENIPGIPGHHAVPSGTLPIPTGTAPIPTGTAPAIPKINL
ncbi:hypothetical protein HII31_12879 [Pseudocercospora fuligena]|uniref:Uncharacterized protein n=1 Tax=Pseudocercospora fuligena TaxID=685502 RepID=A0A8H6R8H2_9PEZI|nr:hypothetical protein HII31_12879 [Pseudocercospora fuligena]